MNKTGTVKPRILKSSGPGKWLQDRRNSRSKVLLMGALVNRDLKNSFKIGGFQDPRLQDTRFNCISNMFWNKKVRGFTPLKSDLLKLSFYLIESKHILHQFL